MEVDDEIFQIFLTESAEHLETIEGAMLELEQEGGPDVINRILRSAHSIKGGSGFVNLDAIGTLAHALEDVLMKIRDGDLDTNESIISTLLEGFDMLRDMFEREDYGEGLDAEEIKATLRKIINEEGSDKGAEADSQDQVDEDDIPDEETETEPQEQVQAEESSKIETESEEDVSESVVEKKESPPPSESQEEAVEVDDEIFQIFLTESAEHLETIEGAMLELEQEGGPDVINRILRSAHSIKGGSGFVNLDAIGSLAHALEDVLMKIRDGDLSVDESIINNLLAGFDILRDMFEREDYGAGLDAEEIKATLRKIADGEDSDKGAEAEPQEQVQTEDITEPDAAQEEDNIEIATEKKESPPPPSDSQEVVEVDDEIFQIFLTESTENLEIVEAGMLELEQEADPDVINKILRAAHSIKGGSGFVNLKAIASLSHSLEDVLMKIRDGDLETNESIISTLLAGFDSLRDMFERDDYGEGADAEEIKAALIKIANKEEVSEKETEAKPKKQVKAEEVSDKGKEAKPKKQVQAKDTPKTETKTKEDAIEPVVAKKEEVPAPSKSQKASEADEKPKATEKKSSKAEKKQPAKKASAASETIRIRVDLLERLVNTTGEVVLERNQLLQHFKDSENSSALTALSQRISEMQEYVMQTRLQPVGNTFTKFNRIVRDLAKSVSKEINLSISGESVELDRSIIESLSDPLTHLIRNCADHGLESTEDREAAGKDITGNIKLRAFHKSGRVMIEVEDDGKGIDSEKIKAKAVEKGVISPEEAEMMSEEEGAELIFAPGFSTAEQVSSISGRGVGMDVVKSSFEKVGGAVSLITRLGKGTTVRVNLPLTLAIIQSLLIEVDEQRFAIAQADVVEVIRVNPAIGQEIEKMHGKDVFRHRGRVLPLVTLTEVLGIPRLYQPEDVTESVDDLREHLADRRQDEGEISKEIADKRSGSARRDPQVMRFLVLRNGEKLFGLLIDKILDFTELVVKPLSDVFKSYGAYSGCAIMGDGLVILILDPGKICDRARLKFSEQGSEDLEEEKSSRYATLQGMRNVLVFNNHRDEYFTLPLSLVLRVESVAASQIQQVGEEEYVQTRDGNILLIRLEKHLNVKAGPSDLEKYFLIIPRVRNALVGILVSRIVDSVDIQLQLDEAGASQLGVLGTTTIGDHVAIMLDVYSLCEKVLPGFSDTGQSLTKKYRMLLAEDTPFFRKLESGFFESAGFEVTTAVDGLEAWKLLQKDHGSFDIVVSDIEMPEMNGYELVKKIKSDPAMSHLPVMAVTALTDEASKHKGTQAGFDAYEVKIDRDRLVNRAREMVDVSSSDS